jgi:hypothetical protein
MFVEHCPPSLNLYLRLRLGPFCLFISAVARVEGFSRLYRGCNHVMLSAVQNFKLQV